MKKLVAFGALVIVIACTGCKSGEETTPPPAGSAPAVSAGSGKTGSANAPGVMGGPQLTDSGAGAQAGTQTK